MYFLNFQIEVFFQSNYNDLANLLIVPEEFALKLLYSRTMNTFSFSSLFIYLGIYFCMVVLTSGLTLANGLFVPMMLIGGAYGRIVGQLMQTMFSTWNPSVDASIYALVGSTAMMSGFSRITISLCVIVIELTENTQYLMPIMLAVMCAKWVGDTLSKSIYDELMDLKSIPFLEHHPPHSTYELGVVDVMHSNVKCINTIERLSKIVKLLETTTHNGFPVVSNEGPERKKTYRGFILRNQLLILIQRQQYVGTDKTVPGLLEYDYYISLLNHKWTFDKVKTSLPPKEVQKEMALDVRRYMDLSHIVVVDTFSFLDAYRLFSSQGLRHITVVNDTLQVVGIITRHDLLSFLFEDLKPTKHFSSVVHDDMV